MLGGAANDAAGLACVEFDAGKAALQVGIGHDLDRQAIAEIGRF